MGDLFSFEEKFGCFVKRFVGYRIDINAFMISSEASACPAASLYASASPPDPV